MSIPPFQLNGTLPIGEHHVHPADFFATFPPTTLQRQELNQALQDTLPVLVQLKIQAPDMVVDIDGSFVTTKPDDMLICSDDLLRAGLGEDAVRVMLWQSSSVARRSVDVFLDDATSGGMLTLFTMTRAHHAKGIIILHL